MTGGDHHALGSRRRAYRLVPWLVRALVPPATPGTYVLLAGGRTIYTGRSDTDLQRRLVEHARALRGEFFDFDSHAHQRAAFLTECATFHVIDAGLENRIHPAAPASSGDRCPFCRQASAATIDERLQPENSCKNCPTGDPLSLEALRLTPPSRRTPRAASTNPRRYRDG